MLARVLVDGSLNAASSFSDEAVRDPALRPLMAKIKVTVDDAVEALLPDMALRIVATANDGAQYLVEVGNPLGHPNNPMQDEHINEKFIALAEPVLGPARCKSALDHWWRLRDADDVRPLVRLLDVNASI